VVLAKTGVESQCGGENKRGGVNNQEGGFWGDIKGGRSGLHTYRDTLSRNNVITGYHWKKPGGTEGRQQPGIKKGVGFSCHSRFVVC